MFDRSRIKTRPLSERNSKTSIVDQSINPDENSFGLDNIVIRTTAESILKARRNKRPVIMAFGAHVVKNCLSPVVIEMVNRGYISHLSTNGAGSIHDWEFAFQGRSEEDVRIYVAEGQFGLWNETGKFINNALKAGALAGRGYGESIGEMIAKDRFVEHPFKDYSIQAACFKKGIPLTVHPGIGYDITHTHPECDFAALGKTAGIDFLKFVESVYSLEGGVYMSVGSSIMAPMVFEKALSMARNVAHQEGSDIKDFSIVVNDIQEGKWDWGSGTEPPKTDAAYYLRFCKTFNRMGARELHYVKADNRDFICELYRALRERDK